jgi:hypothetical protein
MQVGALGAAATAARSLSAAHYTTVSGGELADFLEQTTGPEREELEAKAKGIENPWHEAWWVPAAVGATRGPAARGSWPPTRRASAAGGEARAAAAGAQSYGMPRAPRRSSGDT